MSASNETKFWQQFGVSQTTVWVPDNSPEGAEVRALAKIAKYDHLLELIASGSLDASAVATINARRRPVGASELGLHYRKLHLKKVGKKKGRADLMERVEAARADLMETMLMVNVTEDGPLRNLAKASVYAARGKLSGMVDLWDAKSGWDEREYE